MCDIHTHTTTHMYTLTVVHTHTNESTHEYTHTKRHIHRDMVVQYNLRCSLYGFTTLYLSEKYDVSTWKLDVSSDV